MRPKQTNLNNENVDIMDAGRRELELIKKEFGTPSYRLLGFEKNPFTSVIGLNSLPNFVDREEERQTFVRYFGQLLRGESKDITILGKKGRGKSHFIMFYYNTLKKTENADFLSGYMLEFIKNEKELTLFVERPGLKGKVVVFIDECENLWFKQKSYFRMLYDSPNVLTVCAWNANSWNDAKRDITATLPKTQTLMLKEMGRDAMMSMLEDRIKNNLVPGHECPISKEAKDMLIDYSKGVPLTLVTTANNCLDYAINKGVLKIDKSVVSDNVLVQGALKQEAKLRVLGSAQLEVLVDLHHLLTSYKREITIAEFCKITHIPRSTMVYNMTKLEKEGIVKSKKLGKERTFTINSEYIEFMENMFDDMEKQRKRGNSAKDNDAPVA